MEKLYNLKNSSISAKNVEKNNPLIVNISNFYKILWIKFQNNENWISLTS